MTKEKVGTAVRGLARRPRKVVVKLRIHKIKKRRRVRS